MRLSLVHVIILIHDVIKLSKLIVKLTLMTIIHYTISNQKLVNDSKLVDKDLKQHCFSIAIVVNIIYDEYNLNGIHKLS